jgi:hypothetical protein
MALPWMAIVDGLLGAKDLVRWARGRGEDAAQLSAAGRLETRLAGVVVSALKEAFDRDHQRFEVERQRLEEERERAERALRMELLRQAGEREMGRLRLLTGVAVVSWLGTIAIAMRLAGGSSVAVAMLGMGVLLLLGAIAAVFSAQSHVGRVLARLDNRTDADDITASAAGAAAPWLIVAGLAASAVAVLFF